MPKLYLMRHGQTQFNLQKLVQGRCDSPLTELGRAQAQAAAKWLLSKRVHLAQIRVSPLGRTRATADIVRSGLGESGGNAGDGAPNAAFVPPITFTSGLIERSYGAYEGQMHSLVPADLWDPGEQLVGSGGEGSEAVRKRMVDTLTRAMNEANGENVLAVSHGSATLQFKKAWQHLAICPQEVPLGNCCILVYEFDSNKETFTCEQIVNHDI